MNTNGVLNQLQPIVVKSKSQRGGEWVILLLYLPNFHHFKLGVGSNLVSTTKQITTSPRLLGCVAASLNFCIFWFVMLHCCKVYCENMLVSFSPSFGCDSFSGGCWLRTGTPPKYVCFLQHHRNRRHPP